jgi:hypothetical protein
MQVLNYFYFIFLHFIGLLLLSKRFVCVKEPFNKNKKSYITGGQAYMMLLFATGLISMSGGPIGVDLQALRLLVLEITLLIGLFGLKGRTRFSLAVLIYYLYMAWLVIGITYSPFPDYGFRVFLKYLYPLLVLLFASKVVTNEMVFFKASLLTRKVGLFVIFLMFITPFVFNLFKGLIWYSTAQAIHYIGLMIFSLGLYSFNRKKWDLIKSIVFIVPCILWVYRTSIMGATVALFLFFIFRYKFKSIPYLVFVIFLFIAAVLYIPAVKSKMFNKDVSSTAIIENKGAQLSKDDIDSNGRFALWDWSLQNYYNGKEIAGSGSGNLQAVFYKRHKEEEGMVGIVHNDYVQILCDSGLIGIVLYLVIYLCIVVHCFFVYINKKYSEGIRLCAIVAGPVAIAMAVTSYTDNTVNYSVATLCYPFGFYGMMLGMIKANRSKAIAKQNKFKRWERGKHIPLGLSVEKPIPVS